MLYTIIYCWEEPHITLCYKGCGQFIYQYKHEHCGQSVVCSMAYMCALCGSIIISKDNYGIEMHAI